MIDYQIWEDKVPENTLSDIANLYQFIFETDELSKFHNRIKNAKRLLFVLAYQHNRLIGFKIGYQKNNEIFYSWLGAIHPDCRKLGIASRLMVLQHDWAKQQNFKFIETKTMNRWKSMLILNLKHGFDIHLTYLDSQGVLKIILQKEL